jgi:hypothetical protein
MLTAYLNSRPSINPDRMTMQTPRSLLKEDIVNLHLLSEVLHAEAHNPIIRHNYKVKQCVACSVSSFCIIPLLKRHIGTETSNAVGARQPTIGDAPAAGFGAEPQLATANAFCAFKSKN